MPFISSRQGVFIKKVDLADAVARRLFSVETIALGAGKSRLATALGISRQTIHNQIDIKKHFGPEGVIQGDNPEASKSKRQQRHLHRPERNRGNRSAEVAKVRAQERQEKEAKQVKLAFSFPSGQQRVQGAEQLFLEEHDREKRCCPGTFPSMMTLARQWNWLELVMGSFGSACRLFMVFVLMTAGNIGSSELLKNVRSREAGIVLGRKRIPCRPEVREWLYSAARQRVARFLLEDFFAVRGAGFVFNDKHCGVFEEEKTFTVDSEPDRHNVTPRRIFVWNKTSRRRASGLAWSGGMEMNTQGCATAILSRRGASENTFEPLHDRHPFHYHPGFKLVENDLEDYQSIQRVDDEGKCLFDFVKCSIKNIIKKRNFLNHLC